jgi:hypothetical protein
MRSEITKLTVAFRDITNATKRLPNIKHDDNPSNGRQFVPKRRAGGHKQTNRNDGQTWKANSRFSQLRKLPAIRIKF